jgi:hypothetical protein
MFLTLGGSNVPVFLSVFPLWPCFSPVAVFREAGLLCESQMTDYSGQLWFAARRGR